MNPTRIILAALLGLAVAGCSNGNNNNNSSQPSPVLDLSLSDPPIALPDTSASFAADVPYDEGDLQRFDIYMPDCDEPTPLVIYIHGGGFTGGDKGRTHEEHADEIREFLQSCVAWASINYTLLVIPDADGDLVAAAAQGGVRTSLNDTARALQFMRYYFASLNLDVDKVALYGGSAGAGSSLWLGTHDDMADPESDDPVLRESTRVSAVGALATQATYDILDWENILLPITEPFAAALGGTDIPSVAAGVGASNYLLTFLGISSLDQLNDPAQLQYRAEVDMLELMDAGDAPIYVHNYVVSLDDLLNVFLHHGLHALAVKARADEVGLHSVAYSEDPDYYLQDPSGEDLVSFLTRHLR